MTVMLSSVVTAECHLEDYCFCYDTIISCHGIPSEPIFNRVYLGITSIEFLGFLPNLKTIVLVNSEITD